MKLRSIKVKRSLVTLLLGIFCLATSRLSATPVVVQSPQFRLETRSVAVSNVSVSAGNASSVLVTYDLASVYGNADVEISFTTNGGSTYVPLGASVFNAGANVGQAVPIGTGRRATWRASESLPNVNLSGVRIRIKGVRSGVTRDSVSSPFVLDTRLTQNLTVDEIVLPPEVFSGSERKVIIRAKAVQLPSVSLTMRVTADSLAIATITVPTNAWVSSSGAFIATNSFLWRPQADECRQTRIVATLDPTWDNRVVESDELTDNVLFRDVRIRVRQVLGVANGCTVYADILNRQAYQAALKAKAAGLSESLVAGSVEVERAGQPVVDASQIVATLDSLASNLTQQARFPSKWHNSQKDWIMPVVYDNSMLWGIGDPLGNIAEGLFPNVAAAAAARKDILVSSVLHHGSIYDTTAMLCDLVPAIIGAWGCFKDVGNLSDDNKSIFKQISKLDYQLYRGYQNELISFDVLDDANSTISEPLLVDVEELLIRSVESTRTTLDPNLIAEFVKGIRKSTLKDLGKDVILYMLAQERPEPDNFTIVNAMRVKAIETLRATDKIRAFRQALQDIGVKVPSGKQGDVINWIAACDAATDELDHLYRQQTCVIDPRANPELFAELANGIGNILVHILTTLTQNAIEDGVKLALKETAILAANKLGNTWLAGTIGSKVAAPLIGLEAGRLLTNFSGMDEYRANALQSGLLIKDFIDEFWYLARYVDAGGPNPQIVCHLLAALRADVDAYAADQAAMFCESGFYGLARAWPGGAEGIEGYRTYAAGWRKYSAFLSSITSPRETLLYGLLASSAVFSGSPNRLVDAFPSRGMPAWDSMSVTRSQKQFLFPVNLLASIDMDVHFFASGSAFEDGLRRLYLHPGWSWIGWQFGTWMEIKVEELSADGRVLSVKTHVSDGGVLREDSADDGYYWDDWAIALNSATRSVRVSVRGRDWLVMIPTSWTLVATVDTSAGSSASLAGTVAQPVMDTSGATALEGESSIVITNSSPFDSNTNGFAEAVKLEGYWTPAEDLPQGFIGVDVLDPISSNSWRCLYGPFSATGGQIRAFNLDIPGVHVSTSASVRVALLNAMLSEIALAPLHTNAFEEVQPAQCEPKLNNGAYDSARRDARWDCNVSWSLVAVDTNAIGQAQMVARAFDTNGTCAVLSQWCWIGGLSESAYSGTLDLSGEPASVVLLLIDDRHVLTEVRNIAGIYASTTRIEAVQPQDATDSDEDGYNDRIPIKILLAGGESGRQSVLLSCTDDAGLVVHEELAHIERSTEPSQWVSVDLPVAPLVFSGVVPPWTLQVVRWFKDDGTLLAVSTVNSDLDVPERPARPPLRFNGSNSWTIVADSMGWPVALRVTLGVENDLAGMLWGAATLADTATNAMGLTRQVWDLTPGTTTLQFDFDLGDLSERIPDGPYLIRNIELWTSAGMRLGHLINGFEIGSDLVAADLTQPSVALREPVLFTPMEAGTDGLFTRVGITLGATIYEEGGYSLELIYSDAATNTLRLDGMQLAAGIATIETNFPAMLLSGLGETDGTIRFLRARLNKGPIFCAELDLTNALSLTGLRIQHAVVDGIAVSEWSEIVDSSPDIAALDVHLDWACSWDCPVILSLRLSEPNESRSWSSVLPVEAVAGTNHTVFRYPGWLFWTANITNPLVAARFEARDLNGSLLGYADNLATSRMWQASHFAPCLLPEMEVVGLDVLPVIDQSGVASGSERLHVRALLRNTGDAPAEACEAVALTTLADHTNALPRIAVPGLYAGQEWEVSLEIEREKGAHQLSVAVDPALRIVERNRLNNVMARSLLIPLDTDGDGMPDLWEHFYFSDFIAARPESDPDEDKAPNWHEFRAGTNPTNDASRFAIDSLDVADKLLWQSAPGKQYRVWWAEDIMSWTRTNSMAVGATNQWPLTFNVLNMRFYRVTVEEQP